MSYIFQEKWLNGPNNFEFFVQKLDTLFLDRKQDVQIKIKS